MPGDIASPIALDKFDSPPLQFLLAKQEMVDVSMSPQRDDRIMLDQQNPVSDLSPDERL